MCVFEGGIRELLVREVHSGTLTGYFGIQKTLDILSEHFYWARMIRDVTLVWREVLHIKRQSDISKRGFILHDMFLIIFGKMLVWISLLGCLELKRVEISLWFL